MPIIKPISGHTNTQRIQQYLEKGGRALSRDFFNLSWDEVEMKGYDESLKENVMWADEMDYTRESFGNDRPHGGKPARTFKHYVVSPDPSDHVGLEALRTLVHAWVTRSFPHHQIAIIYHDDNAGKIPHAHVVVNNTNLVTGTRLQDPFPRVLNRALQNIAKQQGLGYLSDEVSEQDGFIRLSQKRKEPSAPVYTKQDIYMRSAERRVLRSGEYSWVNDIRDRVGIAKNLARNEEEFRQILKLLNVDMRNNSVKARRDDWIYSLQDQSSKCVSGQRLGYTFGKEALSLRFNRDSLSLPQKDTSKRFLKTALRATELNDLQELHKLSSSLETNARFGIASLDDYVKRINQLENKLGQNQTPKQQEATASAIDRLKGAREFSIEKEILPPHRLASPKKISRGQQRKAAAARSRDKNILAKSSRSCPHDLSKPSKEAFNR